MSMNMLRTGRKPVVAYGLIRGRACRQKSRRTTSVETGQKTLMELFDRIEVNVSADTAGLSFEPPKDYKISRTPPTKTENPLQSAGYGTNGDVLMNVWHCFNIDDKAILLCWFCEPCKTKPSNSKPDDSIDRLEFFWTGSSRANTGRSLSPTWMVAAGIGRWHGRNRQANRSETVRLYVSSFQKRCAR